MTTSGLLTMPVEAPGPNDQSAPAGDVARREDTSPTRQRGERWRGSHAWQPSLAPRASVEERARAGRYPLSRWYVRPLAGVLARLLTKTVVRPWHLTLCGLLSAALAAGILMWQPAWSLAAAGLVLLAWFFDRADGQLARRQSTDSAWGAWLDANVDELVDLGMHVAMAIAAVNCGMSAAWPLLVAFVVGKYLLMYGLNLEAHAPAITPAGSEGDGDGGGDTSHCNPRSRVGLVCFGQTRIGRLLRAAYHLPANADVRVHLLVVALAGGWWIEELAMVAGYYNLRWMARYALVARRLGRLGR